MLNAIYLEESKLTKIFVIFPYGRFWDLPNSLNNDAVFYRPLYNWASCSMFFKSKNYVTNVHLWKLLSNLAYKH